MRGRVARWLIAAVLSLRGRNFGCGVGRVMPRFLRARRRRCWAAVAVMPSLGWAGHDLAAKDARKPSAVRLGFKRRRGLGGLGEAGHGPLDEIELMLGFLYQATHGLVRL